VGAGGVGPLVCRLSCGCTAVVLRARRYQGQDLHLQHTGSGPASSADWDTLAYRAVRTRIELALGGRQPPRFPDAYRTGPDVRTAGWIRTSKRCLRRAAPVPLGDGVRESFVAPEAGFEPAVALRRVVNSHLACHSPHSGKSGRAVRAAPWGISGSTHAVSSTARESNPARRFGRPGPSRSDSGTNELRAGLAPACDEVATRRLSLRSSGASDAWGAGELCSPRAPAGGFGNARTVPIFVGVSAMAEAAPT
jgi:hypothetical protein